MKLAICIGHSRKNDNGAVSTGGVNEWTFNTNLGAAIKAILMREGIACEVENHYEGSSYGESIRWLAALVKRKGYTHAIELHFNAAQASAKGHEFLHHRDSTRGRSLAQSLAEYFQKSFPNSPARGGGVKAIAKGGRGDLFVALTHCPAVICEPFFGTNPGEWAQVSTPEGNRKLAEALAAGLIAHLKP